MPALPLLGPLALWLAATATPLVPATTAWPDAGRLAAGGRHTCAVMNDATVRCWGDNRGGQLGDGSVEPRTVPVAVVGLADVTQIAAGTAHTCALRRDRSVACWGTIELIRPRTKFAPADVALRTITDLGPADAIFAGRSLTCAVIAGRPWCWGTSERRERKLPTPVPDVRDVDEIAIGYDYLCTRSGGTVACATPDPETWEVPEKLTPLAGITDAVDLAAQDRGLCLLRTGGKVVCLGQHTYPDQDRGAFEWLKQVEVADLDDAVRLMPGGTGHSCAVQDTGDVRCWGEAHEAQLGQGLSQPWRRPVAVHGLRAPRAMAGGWGHTCAIAATGKVLCWGRNDAGQAGHLELDREIPELHRDPRNDRDSVASQMRSLLRRRLVPHEVLDLAAP